MLDVERELYRDRYAAELDRRSQINDRVDSMFNLLALLAGVLLFLFSYNDLSLPWCRFLYWGMLSLGILLLVGGGIQLYCMFMSDQALYIPDPLPSHNYHKALVHADAGQAVPVETVIADQISQDYLEAAQFNAERNDGRERRLRRAKIFFSLSLAAIILAVIPLSADFIKKPAYKDIAHGHAAK